MDHMNACRSNDQAVHLFIGRPVTAVYIVVPDLVFDVSQYVEGNACGVRDTADVHR